MNLLIVNFMLVGEGKMPARSYKGGGFDLYSAEKVVLQPGQVTKFKLGIRTEFSEQFVAMIVDRSSMGAKGVHVFGALVDADYRGEWHAMLYNSTTGKIPINIGDRVCQVVFFEVQHPKFIEVTELSKSERGDGGFGSSGK